MIDQTEEQAFSATPTLARLGRRALLSVGLVLLVLVGLWLWAAWYNTGLTHLKRTRMISSLVAGYAENYFNFLSTRLERLGDDLIRVDALHNLDKAAGLLHQFKAMRLDLTGVTMVLPDGGIYMSSESQNDAKFPNAISSSNWRGEFQNDLNTSGLNVNRVRLDDVTNTWIIPLTFTVKDEGGRVAFLIQTGLRLAKQQELWRSFQLTDEAVVMLLREDGFLISQFPGSTAPEAYLTKDNDALLNAIKQGPISGSFKGVLMNGGVKHYGGYTRLHRYPIYASLSFPESAVSRVWWRGVRIPLHLIWGVLLAGALLYWLASKRFARRMHVIQQRLEQDSVERQHLLPSSGIREIDILCGALLESQEKLRRAADNREKLLLSAAQAGTYEVSISDGKVMVVNEMFLNMLGMCRDDVVGRPWADLFSMDAAIVNNLDLQPDEQSMARRIVCYRHSDGSQVWLSLAEYEARFDGEAIRCGLAINVSEREQLLETVRNQSERFHDLWQLATDRSKSDEEKTTLMLMLGLDALHMDSVAIAETTNEQIIIRYLSDRSGMLAIEQMFGLINEPASYSSTPVRHSVFVHDIEKISGQNSSVNPVVAWTGSRAYVSIPIWLGSHLYGALLFLRQEPLHATFAQHDIAFMELLGSWFGQTLMQQKQRDHLENLAMTDSLTGLPNRRAAELRFVEEIARVKRTVTCFSVAICDLDHFKQINDTYGHETGDIVLRHISNIMCNNLRGGDWVARWGGEEFLVFIHQCCSEGSFTAMDRLRVAIKSQPVETRHGPLDVTASIGIGLFIPGEKDMFKVLAEADQCLYEAKRKGRNRVIVKEALKIGK